MRIVAADSSAAILNDKFEPQFIVATVSALVNAPYREPVTSMAEAVYADANLGHEVIVHEAELCRDLLAKVEADIVHLDLSLDAMSLEELSPIELGDRKIYGGAKRQLLKILPRLRKIAAEIKRKYEIDMIAIGKESVPVRIAELTGGSYAILFTCEKALKDNKAILLGLPSKCQPMQHADGVYLCSLIPAEHDMRGFAPDPGGVLKKVNIVETLNPIARGFRALKIAPKNLV